MGYPVSLLDRAEDAHKYAVRQGFWEGVNLKDPNVFAAKLALIHSEVSESLEAARENKFEQYLGKNGKPEGAIAELADVVIRVFDLAEAMRMLGICSTDIESAIRDKMMYNETREFKHGKSI